MRTALSTLEVERPRSLKHALALLGRTAENGRLVPLAGGTDLYVTLNAGQSDFRRFLDLNGLHELKGIRAGRTGLTVGALTTFSEIREHAAVRRRAPCLADAAAVVGARQIQNRATLGGNIANGSPAGDSLPVLLAHDAVVRVRSARGGRGIPFERFYRGYRDADLAADELIVEVDVAFPPPRARSFFRKVGTRRAQSISKVVFCGVIRLDRRGHVDHARLAWGSVAPVPVRSRQAELALLGARASVVAVRAAREALTRDIAPIDDIRSDREYRLAVAGNLLEQFLLVADPHFARR